MVCGGNNWGCVINSAAWPASSTERVMMSLYLPPPVDLYVKFENSGEVEAQAGCFSLKATVRDEHRTYEGLVAIKEWKAETKKKYGHTIHPLEITDRDGKTVLKAELIGNFPGSPVTVEFSFVLENGKIVFLDIR
jgi:hypothetical protein